MSPFHTPTLADLIDNLKEHTQRYREQQARASQLEIEASTARSCAKDAKSRLDAAEYSVMEYLRTNGVPAA